MIRSSAGIACLALVAILGLAGCGSAGPPSGNPASREPGASAPSTTVAVDGGSYTSVAPAELARMLRAKQFPLINVHVPYDGEIDPTDAFIPFETIGARLADLPPDKTARIVLYCRTGRMSAIAAATLVRLGYTNVWELAGGMEAWAAAGFPLASRPPA